MRNMLLPLHYLLLIRLVLLILLLFIFFVVFVVDDAPLFIETDGLVGAVESEIVRVIESLADADIFPAVSLNQT